MVFPENSFTVFQALFEKLKRFFRLSLQRKFHGFTVKLHGLQTVITAVFSPGSAKHRKKHKKG